MLLPRDQYHAAAARVWQTILRTRREMVTTNLVVSESHAMIARRAGVAAGLQFLETFTVPGAPRLVWANRDITQTAVEHWLQPYRDKVLSLTDAVSFEVMRRENMPVAFSYDRDFQAVGFDLLKT